MKRTEPKVYIIILNWNQYLDTKECLESLSKITYQNRSVIIVDNGSSDDSVDRLQKEFPGYTFIRSSQNLGFTGGNNLGIKKALAEGADYVLLLNNDTTVEPDFLSKLVEEAEKDPKIGIIGPKIYYYHHPDTLWFGGGGINPFTGQTYHFGLNQVDRGQFDANKEIDFVTGCALFFKKEIVGKIGLLDEDYFFSYEDVDFCVKAKKAGYKSVYVPTAVIYHKFAKSAGGRFSPLYIYFRVRNNLLFDIKNKRPWYQFLFHLFFSPGKHLIYALWTLHFKGIKALWLGFWDFCSGKKGIGSGKVFMKGI
jgi:GT2 family glycosyltransferase